MPVSRESFTTWALLGFVCVGLAATSAHADPRKLAMPDLTESQEKQLWERTSRYADYAAILKQCNRDVQFERRIRAQAEPCIEAETLDKVAAYYRRQFNRMSRIIKTNLCMDKDFIERGLEEKLRLTLEDQIKAVTVLCTHYQRTGIFRSER